jgi:hypothetical protein
VGSCASGAGSPKYSACVGLRRAVRPCGGLVRRPSLPRAVCPEWLNDGPMYIYIYIVHTYIGWGWRSSMHIYIYTYIFVVVWCGGPRCCERFAPSGSMTGPCIYYIYICIYIHWLGAGDPAYIYVYIYIHICGGLARRPSLPRAVCPQWVNDGPMYVYIYIYIYICMHTYIAWVLGHTRQLVESTEIQFECWLGGTTLSLLSPAPPVWGDFILKNQLNLIFVALGSGGPLGTHKSTRSGG